MSGRYLGFRASASAAVDRSANERTVMMYFYYGRVLAFAFTFTASTSEIKAAVLGSLRSPHRTRGPPEPGSTPVPER